MKNIILILILFSCFTLTAQTPFTVLSSHGESPAALSASSQVNPWVGAKLVYNVSGDVSESFLLSGRVLYVAAAGERYAFPIVGNVGLNNADSLSVDNGVSIGVFPYYILNTGFPFKLLLHGGLNYRTLVLNDASLNEFRVMAGLEAALYPRESNGSPTTLSVAPEYVINTIDAINNSWGLNITGVLPIANGLGLMLEGTVPLNNESTRTGFKIGVIVNADID